MRTRAPSCPGCESSNTRRETDNSEFDYVCSDCGFVWDSKLSTDQQSSNQFLNDSNTDSDSWEAWYPCPECGSTKFKQTQITTVYGSQNGDYDGEDINDQFEKIECDECGIVLNS